MSDTKFCVIIDECDDLWVINQSAIDHIETTNDHYLRFVTNDLDTNGKILQKDLDFQNAIDCLKREQLKVQSVIDKNDDNYNYT